MILGLATAGYLLTSASGAWADDDYVPVYHPTLEVRRAEGTIRIDGDLGDEGWQGTARAGNFAEHNPGDQTRPAVDTEVLVTYDDENLYVAWLCYDDPDEVRASFCERDEIFSDDYVILCIDTYGDATLAYEISANPYGIPGDLLYSSANGEDISYDMIFESAGRITEFGWVVEMAVPFRSLRFPRRDEQLWRVDFWRNRPRESRYQYSWAAYDRDVDCWPCQWGTVGGIRQVNPGAGLELLPAVTAHQSGVRLDDGDFENEAIKGELSLGVAYDFSSELTAEATVNPDFSQVESDVAQIDVNTTFALFYPERRPFFQEGSDLFNSYFSAVYTRSINDPLVAGKMTLRKGSNSAALLTAMDQHSVIILPFEESSEFVANGESYSNIVRARHDFGEQSHVGAVVTDRRFRSGGSGTLFGVDGRYRFSQSDAVQFQLLATHTEEVDNPALTDSAFSEIRFDGGRYTAALDGERFWGHGAYAALMRNARSYWLGVDYVGRSPTCRADNGFEPSNNSQVAEAWLGGIVRFDDSDILESVNGQVNGAREWNFDGVQKDEWIVASMQLQLRAAQTALHLQRLSSNELFSEIQFDGIWQNHVCLSVRPSGGLAFGGNYDYGHRIARYDLVMGKETNTGVWADVKPIDRLLLSASFYHTDSDAVDTDGRLFDQNIMRLRMSLQFSRELSARLVLQYNDRYDTWEFDPLLTYRINSLSIFYVGTTQDYRNLESSGDGGGEWALTDRQYFLKLQYLVRI
ncbi:MAG: carbohydrate binding family 9 domain-containing protein [Candidatus Krumholzibacteria bacterium]|nr:carbohydrate binding family 9 domain-containing protein [Candidatus Krumholzibacteria bacterium]